VTTPGRPAAAVAISASDTAVELPTWELTLFVIGASDLSARAIANARRLCDAHLEGRYRLAIIDLHENPDELLASNVLAAPTLVRNRPLPVRKLVGDLSQTDKVLLALGLAEPEPAPRPLG
jgi:circadian clock protein KaiB